MVATLRSTALAPPREPVIDVFYVDGGYSRIFVSTSQRAHRRYFLAMMVDALEPTTPAPPMGLTVDIF
jgi:hypothetical protein